MTSEPAVLAPATAITPPPTRARNPRRDVLPATLSLSFSGTDRAPAPLGGGEHALELAAGVEGPLREHDAVGADRDRERAARHVGQRPDVGVLDLVEAPQPHAR